MGKKAIVDLETGEKELEFDSDTHDADIRSKKQKDAFKKKLAAKVSMDFTITNMEGIKTVISHLSDAHCGYILYLQCFIDWNGRLVKTTQKPMTKLDIQDILKLGRTQFNEFYVEASKHEIILEKDDGYYINPEYHLKGATDNKKIIRTFTNTVKQLYTKKNAKDLGFIYKVLPYIHYITNTICFNPYDQVDDIREMTQDEIAELTGVERTTIYRKMKKMKLGDEFVFAEVNVGKKTFYKINPFLFYRGEGDPDKTLKEIFILGKIRRGR